jgi:Arc/MetJ family transcription regulator
MAQVHMKKTMNIDAKLLKEAKEACGAATDTDTVRLGLEALVRHAAYQQLRKFAGTMHGKFTDVPRRRMRPPAKRSAA